MTLQACHRQFIEKLTPLYDQREAASIARLVLEQVLGLRPHQLIIEKHRELKKAETQQLLEMLESLATGKPVQYVIGEADFYGLRFRVDPHVLIPRQETEELVDWVIRDAREPFSGQTGTTPKLLDIGTGSGCIAIACKKHLPHFEVYGLDIIREALATARHNAAKNRVAVHWVQGDILGNHLPDKLPQFDVIVSNPPYITEQEKAEMHRNVVEHEPAHALFIKNEEPLRFYQAITEFAQRKLPMPGQLYLEINPRYKPNLLGVLQKQAWQAIKVENDLNGAPRFIRAGK